MSLPWIHESLPKWDEAKAAVICGTPARALDVRSYKTDDLLECAAAERRLNYLYNVVPPKYPDRDVPATWLRERHFEASRDDERLMHRVHPEQQGR